MNITEINNYFPDGSTILELVETRTENSIINDNKYKGFLKIHDSFIYLFSDDINNTIDFKKGVDPIVLMYSEAAKRIRSSAILAKKGYFVDSVSLLRSVYELNKGINAIHNNLINSTEYFGKNRPEFESLDDRQQERIVNEHIREVDNIVNGFDDRNIPENLRPSLRNFKSIFHISVHKSLGNIALNFREYITQNGGNLFQPHDNKEIFELYLNSCSFVILMYLRNIRKSGLLLNNEEKINWLIGFIEFAYSSMDGYHKNIVDYIKFKF